MTPPRFAADENLDERLLRALLRRAPRIDVLRVRDAGLRGRPDEDILSWAADSGRVLLTHDARTIPATAYQRVAARRPMPGVVVLPTGMAARDAIDDLELIARASAAHEWRDRVVFLPLAR